MCETFRLATSNFSKIGNIEFVYNFLQKIPSLVNYWGNSKKSQIEIEFFPVLDASKQKMCQKTYETGNIAGEENFLRQLQISFASILS